MSSSAGQKSGEPSSQKTPDCLPGTESTVNQETPSRLPTGIKKPAIFAAAWF
jgi:hypothetical protein